MKYIICVSFFSIFENFPSLSLSLMYRIQKKIFNISTPIHNPKPIFSPHIVYVDHTSLSLCLSLFSAAAVVVVIGHV